MQPPASTGLALILAHATVPGIRSPTPGAAWCTRGLSLSTSPSVSGLSFHLHRLPDPSIRPCGLKSSESIDRRVRTPPLIAARSRVQFSRSRLSTRDRRVIRQDRFKGVGSILSGHETLSERERSYLVRSFYLSDNLRAIRDYFDVRFTADETGFVEAVAEEDEDDDVSWEDQPLSSQIESGGTSFLEIFLHEVSKVKSRSKRYTRYYLPTLVAMLRSLDFSDLEYDGNEWRSVPYLFEQVFISKRFDKIFTGAQGYELLYWAAVDEIYRQRPDLSERSRNQLMISMLSRRGVFSELDAIPGHVADQLVKDDMIARKARYDALIRRSS